MGCHFGLFVWAVEGKYSSYPCWVGRCTRWPLAPARSRPWSCPSWKSCSSWVTHCGGNPIDCRISSASLCVSPSKVRDGFSWGRSEVWMESPSTVSAALSPAWWFSFSAARRAPSQVCPRFSPASYYLPGDWFSSAQPVSLFFVKYRVCIDIALQAIILRLISFCGLPSCLRRFYPGGLNTNICTVWWCTQSLRVSRGVRALWPGLSFEDQPLDLVSRRQGYLNGGSFK